MPKTKRVKSKQTLKPIIGWDQADELVREVGGLLIKIQAAQAKAKKEIDEVKSGLALEVKPLQNSIAQHTASIEAFAVNRKKDFKAKRSKKLNFGTLGWRKSVSIKVKKTTLSLIKKVFMKKADAYIRIKESVDKEALAKLTDEQLAKVTARRVVMDDFFVEPFIPEAIDYDSTMERK